MIVMLSKPFCLFKPFGRFFVPLFFLLLIGGCGGGGDSKGPAAPVESDPAFSMPFPKGMWAPLPNSDLVMTAQAVIDPGTAGERTVDLTVDLSTNRVAGAIEGVPAGPHTVEIRYFINQVQVAAVTLSVDVVPGQNNPAEIAPAAIRYIEAVSDTLFVADAADPSIKMFDRYSTLPGGRVSTAPTRTLRGENTGIVGPSSGSLFVDSIGGRLYFADAADNSVSVWNNAATVNGDTPPDRVLKGPETRLLKPTGIAVDPFRDRLYVVNSNGEILIWSNLSSLEGEIPPAAAVVGSLVAGDHPVFLDVKRDTLYVANGREISVFKKLSGLTGDIQNVAPVPAIRIAGKSLSQPGLALDYNQNLLFVSSRDPNGTIYGVAGASTASEEIVPAATLAGPETGLDQTAAVTLAGNVFMALNLAGTEIRVWHQADQKDGDRSPTQILELDPNASPEALFYVATQNGERDQAEFGLTVQKSGQGSVTSDLPGINCGTTCVSSFPVGSNVTLTATAESGFTFTGWGGACSGTGVCVVTMDSAKTVTVTFGAVLSVSKTGTGSGAVTSSPAGIDCGNDCSEPYLPGTQVTLTAGPDANSNFTGWSGGCSGTGNCVVTMDSAKSVVANFNVKQFGLTVSKSGTGAGTVTSDPAGVNCGTDCTETYNINTSITLTASPDINSNFTGWSGACTGTGNCVITMDTAKSVTATFTLKSLGISVTKTSNGNGTVTSNPAGINCGTDCSELYTINTQVSLTATPAADSNFTGWSGACTGTGACNVTVDAAKSVTAAFTLKTFNLTVVKSGNGTGTVTSNPAGINCGADCSEVYNFGTQVTLTPTASADSDFTGWSGACSGSGNCVVTLSAARSVTATFALKTFSLTVSKDGTGAGTLTSNPTGINCGATCSASYNINTSVILTAAPAASSDFASWSGCDSVNGTSCTVNVNTAKSVTATFTLKSFALTVFKAGTGTGVVTSSPAGINCGADCSDTYTFGASVTLTPAPTSDSDFTGWSGACTGTGSCVVTVDAAKTVTATFTLKTFVLTVAKSGSGSGTIASSPAGINCGTDCSETYNINTLVFLTATPSSGSEFSGWSGACSGAAATCSVTMDSAKTVTANFIRHFPLTVSKAGTGAGTVTSAPVGIDCGADCSETYVINTSVTLTAAPDGNSTFTGWSGGCTGTGTCVVTMDAAKTVTATFNLRSLGLSVAKAGNGNGTVASNPGGISCGTDCSELYDINTQVSLTATPAVDSTFTGWSGACTGTGTCTVTIDATKTVTATFTLRTFTLTVTKSGAGDGTVTSSPAGINCGTGCTQSYNAGTQVTLTANPDGTSNFAGWSGCVGSANSCVVTMDAARTVTASFAPKPVLTVTKGGAGTGTVTGTGINCGTDCSESYDNFTTQVTLTAAPAADSTFTGWSGACTGTGNCVVTMDAAKTVTATFALQTFSLTVTKTGTGGGTVSSSPAGINCGTDCTQAYDAHTQVTLTASANGTSIFTGWSGACTAATGNCVVTMDAARTVTASFTLRPVLTVAKTGTGTGTVTGTGINCGTDCTQSYTNFTTQVTLTANASADSDFTGWSGACSGTGSCVVTMDAAKTVTATFTLKSFALTVTRTGTGSGAVTSSPAGIDCGIDCSETYTVNTVVTLTATPAADSDFTGWSGACTGTGTCNVTIDAAKSVTANFNLKPILTVTKAGTGSGTVTSSPLGINCGADCSEPYNVGTQVTLTAAPAGDSDFTGWTGACSGTGSCVVTIDAAKTVTAAFTPKSFALNVTTTGNGTVTSNPAGINCGTDCSETYNVNTSVTLTAAPALDSDFTGWGGACTGSAATCNVTMDAAKTVTATFTLKNFVLTVTRTGTGSGAVTSSPAGIDCGIDCSETYTVNTVVTLTATPAADSDFTGWSGACTGTGTCNVTVDAAKSVTAAFTLKTFNLTVVKSGNGTGTVTSNPAGINCGADCSEVYNFGTQVTLTPTAFADSDFTGWSGACSGTGSCVVTMDAAKTVTATFTLQSVPLTVTKSGTGTGTVTSNPAGINCGTDCGESYNVHTQVTLTAAADEDALFTGWSGDCSGIGICAVTMEGARSITATFIPKPVLSVTKTGAGTGTVTSNPAGINCGADCTETYNNLTTQVTLTAEPDLISIPPSEFIGWTGCDSVNGTSCIVTMDSNKSVQAQFEPLLGP